MATFVKSEDTKILEHVLRESAPEELITYQKLTAAIGRNVQKEAYGLLSSARHALEADGIVFECVPNDGLQRLDASGVIRVSASGINRARTAARKQRRRLERVDVSNLQPDIKRELMNRAAQLSAIEIMSGKKAGDKIAKIPDEKRTNGHVSFVETVRLMTKGD